MLGTATEMRTGLSAEIQRVRVVVDSRNYGERLGVVDLFDYLRQRAL